jgi:hypothetical protein
VLSTTIQSVFFPYGSATAHARLQGTSWITSATKWPRWAKNYQPK